MNRGKANSFRKKRLESFLGNKPAVIGGVICILEIMAVLFVPLVFKLDPYSVDQAAFGTPPGVSHHLLGTDPIGRDVFSRLVYGGRVSLFVGLFSTLVSVLIGVPVGLISGFFRGIPEVILMRATDIAMSFPSIILVLVAVSIVGPGMWSVSVIIGIMGWTQFARITYSKTLTISQMEYIVAARAAGISRRGIMLKYILPNVMPPILIAVTFHIASAILTESSLSFLGMGVQPPMASWGNMMYDARSIAILASKQWMWIPAGTCILMTVLSINFLGDGIRDAVDPKVNHR